MSSSSGACLVWESPHGRVIHALDRAVLILGREEVSDIVVIEPAVSRRHALIQVDGNAVTVTDLGSSGGTKINGARLAPDLPSTLEPGDMIQVGRVTLVFHETEPPPAPLALQAEPAAKTAVKARAAPARAKPQVRPVVAKATGAAVGSDTWKWVALGSAFLAVGIGGALIAVLVTRSDEAPVDEMPARVEEERPVEVVPEPTPDPIPDPVDDEEPPELDPMRAPEGELPPQAFYSASDYPSLLEIDGKDYYPVQLGDWDVSRVPAVGGDGRTYTIPRRRVTKSENRLDLASRAARARASLDPDDADAQLALAQWCAKRYIKRETRLLAKRVLELRPGDEEAQRLLRLVE